MPHHRATLLEGDIAPQLRSLSLPLMWGMVAMTAFTVIDTLYISRLGTVALAALGFVLPIVMLFQGVIFGLTVGGTSAMSRLYGEGDMEKVRRLATDSMVLMAITVGAASIAGYFMITPVFALMGAKPELMPMIHHYMTIWYSGMVFMGLLFGGNACIRATGDTRFPSAIMTLLAVISLCLDPFLIFGWGPFPEMGFAGAAMTLTTANILACMTSLYVLIFRKKALMPQLFHTGTLQAWRRILHVGIPSMISNLIGPLSAAVVTWLAADLGKEAVAALGVATRIEGLVLIMFYSLGAGVSIFTGQNFGAGNFGRVTDIVQIACKYATIGGFAMAALLWTFASDIPAYFDSHPAVIAYTAQYLHIVPVSYAAMGIMIITGAAMNAMGKPLPATCIILLRAFVLYVPLAYFAEKHYGFAGIIFALAATNMIVGLISYLWNKIVTP